MVEPLIIEKIKLMNFISHRDTEINLIPGVNVFIGKNGSGKSSIFEAIYYGFIGDGWRNKPSKLVNHNASTATVEIHFRMGNDKYVLRRSIGKPDNGLWRNGKLIAHDQKGLDTAIREILGIDAEKMENLILIMQGDITRLFKDLKPSDRKEVIDTLLGIYEYREAFEKMKDLRIRPDTRETHIEFTPYAREDLIRRSIKELESKIHSRYRDIVERINSIKREIEELRKEREELEKSEEIKKLREKAEQYPVLEKKYSELNREKTRLETQYNSLRENIEKEKKKIMEKRSRLEEIEKELEKIREDLKILEIEEKINRLREKYVEKKHLSEKLEALRKRYSELEKIVREIRELESKIPMSREELLSKKKEIMSRFEKLVSEKEELVKKETGIGERLRFLREEEKKYRSDLENAVKRVESFIGSFREYSELIKYLEEFREKLLDEYEELRRSREEYSGRKEQLKTMVRDLDEKIRLLRESREPRCPLCGAPLDENHRAKMINEFEEERKRYMDELGEVEEKLRTINMEIKVVEEKLGIVTEDYIDSVRKALEKINEASREISVLERELGIVREKLEKINNDLEEIEKEREEIENYIGLADRLETLRKNIDLGEYEELVRKVVEEEERYRLVGEEYEKLLEEVTSYLGITVKDHDVLFKELEEMIGKARVSREKSIRLREEKRNIELEINRLGEEVSRLEDRLRLVREEVEKISGEIEEVERELGEAEKAREELEEIRERIARIEERINAKKSELSSEEERLEELRREVGEINKAIYKVYVLRWIREQLFKETLARELRKQYVGVLTRKMTSLLKKFGIMYNEAVVDENYNVYLYSDEYPGKATDIHNVSGGELIASCLIALLALHSLVIGGRIGFMALDEPTSDLDEDRREELVDLLKEFQGGNYIPQLLIVTHEDIIREAGDKVFSVEKIDGYSRVEEIYGGE